MDSDACIRSSDSTDKGKKYIPLDLAYAMTIHKSQGSEFDKVLVILDEKAKNLSKKALYTPVTRAKKDIEIISEKETLFEIMKSQVVDSQ